MTDESELMPIPTEEGCALSNTSVALCWQAWVVGYRKSIEQGKSEESARKFASRAYRAAMPPLAGIDNINNFIACVAHGILIDAINTTEGSRLLYAAQVASTTTRPQAPKPLPYY
jgi:hypothetical protein